MKRDETETGVTATNKVSTTKLQKGDLKDISKRKESLKGAPVHPSGEYQEKELGVINIRTRNQH